MSATQILQAIGAPLTVMLATIVLLAIGRPDRDDDGPYVAYLGLTLVFTLVGLLLAASALVEAIGRYLTLDSSSRGDSGGFENFSSGMFFLFGDNGRQDLTPTVAWAAAVVVLALVFAFHHFRLSEISATGGAGIERMARAYRASVSFAMVSVGSAAALGAGSSGYTYFGTPIATTDRDADLALAAFVANGALLLATYLIFRVTFWQLRAGGARADAAAADEPGLVDTGER